MFRLREGAGLPEVGALGAFGSGVQGPGAAVPPPPPGRRLRMVGWSGVSNCWRRGAGRRRRRACPFPGAPGKPCGPREPRFLLVSAELPSCLFRSPCAPALSFCLSCPLGLLQLPRIPFSLWVRSQGRLGPHLPFLCPVPFPLTLDLRRLPQFGARPSPVPEVLGGRTVPNSLGSSPPVAEEHRASGTARLGTSAFSGSVSLCFPGPAVLGKVWQGLPLLAKSLLACHLRMVSGWDSTFLVKCLGNPVLA